VAFFVFKEFMPDFDIDFNTEDFKNSIERTMFVQNAFVREVKDYSDDLEEEKDSYKAYFSDSWKTDVKQARENKGLPVSDVARFASVVDTISGNERQNRTDVTVHPFEKNDQVLADLANNYLKYRNRKESQWHENSLAFINAIIARRAHYEFFLRSNPNDGSPETVRIQRPASEVFVQRPFRDITGADSKGTLHVQWVYVDDLIRRFKDKIPNINFLDTTQDIGKPQTEVSHLLDSYDFPDKKEEKLFFKRNRKMVRVIRYWRRRKIPIFRILNPKPNSFSEILVGSESTRKKALVRAVDFLNKFPEIAISEVEKGKLSVGGELITEATSNNIEIIANELIEEQVKDSYTFHHISGRVELDYVEDWGDFLPWTHMFCYFVDGRPGGLYERIKDLIQEVNFIHSKLMQRLGTMGKMPLGIERGALDMTKEAAKDAYEDGGIIDFKDQAITQNKFHAFEDKTLSSIPAYIGLEESLNNTIKELTGANDPLQGRSPGANTAGIAIELLQRKGSALIAPIQDNFKRFKMESARMEINMLLRAHNHPVAGRPLWTSMKLARIIGGLIDFKKEDDPLAQRLKSADSTTQEGDETGIVTEINNMLTQLSSMEYDMAMDETITSPTLKMLTLQQLVQMAVQAGIAIPPQMIIGESELPQQAKDDFAKFQTTNEAQAQLALRNSQGGSNTNGTPENFA